MSFSLASAGIVVLLAFQSGTSLSRLVTVLALGGAALLMRKLMEASAPKKAQMPSAQYPKAGQLPKPASESALQALLENGGIKTDSFGTGKTKSLSSLMRELNQGECALHCGKLTGRITRTVEPIFVVLHFNGKVLVETSQIQPNGNKRERFMVLAEKRNPSDSSPLQTAIRGLCEELHLGSGTELPTCIGHCKDKDACFFEEKDSDSYPGLPCVYQNHQIHFDIRLDDDSATQLLSPCGLPDCRPFETVEERPDGVLRHSWTWVDIQEAEGKAKGMHCPKFCM